MVKNESSKHSVKNKDCLIWKLVYVYVNLCRDVFTFELIENVISFCR
mgnify:CR=1 FL=1